MVAVNADFSGCTELLMFLYGVCHDLMVRSCWWTTTPTPPFCIPLSIDSSVEILRYVGPFTAMIFLAITSCLDGEDPLEMEARSMSG